MVSTQKNPDGRLLRCRDLEIGYGGKPLLPPFDFEIAAGEMVLVAGGNGAGKSTWIKTILGMIPPVRGRVELAPGTRLAYVPQESGIDEIVPVSARDVAGWGRLRGWGFLNPFAIERSEVNRALDGAGASGFAGDRFSELSGGQRQRVLFSRMLAGDANLALLDEPTASLDLTAEREAYEQMVEMANRHGLGLIVVTHTLEVAARYAQRALFFDRGRRDSGPVVFAGTTDEVFERDEFKRAFGAVPHHDRSRRVTGPTRVARPPEGVDG